MSNLNFIDIQNTYHTIGITRQVITVGAEPNVSLSTGVCVGLLAYFERNVLWVLRIARVA